MLNPPWTGWVWTTGKGWGGPRLIRAHLLFSFLSKVLLIFLKKDFIVKTFTSTSESRFRDCRVLFAWNSTHYWLIADNIFYPPSFPAFPSQSRTRRTARVPCMWPKTGRSRWIRESMVGNISAIFSFLWTSGWHNVPTCWIDFYTNCIIWRSSLKKQY